MKTTLLFSSLAQKRAGVGVGFRSVLMLAMNLCTHKPPTNFLSRRPESGRRLQKNVLQKIAESATIGRT